MSGKKILILFLVLQFVSVKAVANDFGLISCGQAHLWWHFTKDVDASIESWSQEKKAWISASESVHGAERTSITLNKADKSGPFEVGSARFYRVRACNSTECATTDAVWSPIYSCSDEHTDENLVAAQQSVEITTRDGITRMWGPTNRSKKTLHNIISLNIHLALRELYSHEDPNGAIPMKKPIVPSSRASTWADLMTANVWLFYEKHRTLVDQDITGTAADPAVAFRNQ